MPSLTVDLRSSPCCERAQLGSLGLLALLLYLAPCFDFNNHQECFADHTTQHMIGSPSGLSGALLHAVGAQMPVEGDADGVAHAYVEDGEPHGLGPGASSAHLLLARGTQRMLGESLGEASAFYHFP